MATPDPKVVREHIAWSYANLARAHAALNDGASKYSRIHHIIRSRLYHGLVSGKMSMRSLYDDERVKMTVPQGCCYCGSNVYPSVDHLIPRIKGGKDDSDNLVCACRSCNSSKHGRDMLVWMQSRRLFPPVLLLRRYLKLVARFCEQQGHMDRELSELETLAMPFDLLLLPTEFPPLKELTLWVHMREGVR